MNPLIPALDSDDEQQLLGWAQALAPTSGHLKIGLQAFTTFGPQLVTRTARLAPIFLDLKLHDIPNTVAGAAAAVASLGQDGHGVAMLTVHASGGPAMVAAAVKAAPEVSILAVTVLTSLDDEALHLLGLPSADQLVPTLAVAAIQAGAAGVVCAAAEIGAVRSAIGPQPLIVVPGIRPENSAADDQARVASPRQAIQSGASHIVVGRPITAARDPVTAARAILASL
ncbi:MAG: orotidine-5'-phosphate decarboxylase [Euzebya sp.]